MQFRCKQTGVVYSGGIYKPEYGIREIKLWTECTVLIAPINKMKECYEPIDDEAVRLLQSR